MTESSYHSVSPLLGGNGQPYDDRAVALIDWVSKQTWLQRHALRLTQVEPISADASFRRYFRLHCESALSPDTTPAYSTLVAVDAPPETQKNHSFINLAARLKQHGANTPDVFGYDLESGFLLIQDLGDRNYSSAIRAAMGVDNPDPTTLIEPAATTLAMPLYDDAMATLTRLQQLDGGKYPPYDRDFLTMELELFRQWYLPVHRKFTPNQSQQAVIDGLFELCIETILEQPKTFVHRDYHCRNLMVSDNNNPAVIDFQDAVYGPVTYDAVSLLRDCYLHWPEPFVQHYMEQHRQSLPQPPGRQTYQRWFDFTGLQRHLKVLGLFSRLCYRDDKPDYLNDLPLVLTHIDRVTARYPSLHPFADLMSQIHRPSPDDG